MSPYVEASQAVVSLDILSLARNIRQQHKPAQMNPTTTKWFNLPWISDLHALYNANPYRSSIIRQNSKFRYNQRFHYFFSKHFIFHFHAVHKEHYNLIIKSKNGMDSSHVLTNVNLRSANAKVQSTSPTWDPECLDVSILCVSPVCLCHPDRPHVCHLSITCALSSPSSLCVLLSFCVQYLVYRYEITGCIYINCAFNWFV